jgi:GNAT superfamily N-acetyltransferase
MQSQSDQSKSLQHSTPPHPPPRQPVAMVAHSPPPPAAGPRAPPQLSDAVAVAVPAAGGPIHKPRTKIARSQAAPPRPMPLDPSPTRGPPEPQPQPQRPAGLGLDLDFPRLDEAGAHLVHVRIDPGCGRAAFAAADIPAGRIFMYYIGKHMSQRAVDELQGDGVYVISLPDGQGAIDATNHDAPARYIQHGAGSAANVEYGFEADGRVAIRTLRAVAAGDKLRADYGGGYPYATQGFARWVSGLRTEQTGPIAEWHAWAAAVEGDWQAALRVEDDRPAPGQLALRQRAALQVAVVRATGIADAVVSHFTTNCLHQTSKNALAEAAEAEPGALVAFGFLALPREAHVIFADSDMPAEQPVPTAIKIGAHTLVVVTPAVLRTIQFQGDDAPPARDAALRDLYFGNQPTRTAYSFVVAGAEATARMDAAAAAARVAEFHRLQLESTKLQMELRRALGGRALDGAMLCARAAAPAQGHADDADADPHQQAAAPAEAEAEAESESEPESESESEPEAPAGGALGDAELAQYGLTNHMYKDNVFVYETQEADSRLNVGQLVKKLRKNPELASLTIEEVVRLNKARCNWPVLHTKTKLQTATYLLVVSNRVNHNYTVDSVDVDRQDPLFTLLDAGCHRSQQEVVDEPTLLEGIGYTPVPRGACQLRLHPGYHTATVVRVVAHSALGERDPDPAARGELTRPAGGRHTHPGCAHAYYQMRRPSLADAPPPLDPAAFQASALAMWTAAFESNTAAMNQAITQRPADYLVELRGGQVELLGAIVTDSAHGSNTPDHLLHTVSIEGLAVRAQARKRGCGRMLIEHTAHRYRAATLDVHADNTSTEFYGKCSFAPSPAVAGTMDEDTAECCTGMRRLPLPHGAWPWASAPLVAATQPGGPVYRVLLDYRCSAH